MKTLYKMDSNGKIRQWSIKTDVDKTNGWPIYIVSHGVKDGKMQESVVSVKVGKNIGRSNETTAEEQCKLEAKSLFEKQRDRKGYTENIPTAPPDKPMLAHSYKDHKNKVQFPCAVQPKLDGVRCLAKIENGNVTLFSRTSTIFSGLDHIQNALSKLPNMILDGELFSNDITFQEILSLTRKSKNLTDDSIKIEYHVYDIINGNDFHQRMLDFNHAIMDANSEYIKPVPTFMAKDDKQIIHYHNEFSKTYEGTMIRNLKSKYAPNKRSTDLLKYKDFIDEEFVIIGFKSGKGKAEKVPTFEFVTEQGARFGAVPIGTEQERADYLAKAPFYIGLKATIRYFELTTTENPVPKFPVMVGIRNGV